MSTRFKQVISYAVLVAFTVIILNHLDVQELVYDILVLILIPIEVLIIQYVFKNKK
ncbi:unnamed protein product [Fructobacillus tropaeoli]|uniref:Uncharacterized protein n=1 Tax=Fructobacillus tropaeoli TaxID=709323 RepID=A0A3F3GYU7_9LACO|nr:hypothetical protein FTRO_0013010 [Fructobacillus tropaeoli]CAK1229595.1 unnamed protein product [Fructobacillus tropaeoli]CAK1230902.1 unnamed protein product [Fructobacillus tropaeoli]CAK1232459.1 unnamed protein product [Fructobacillus tropaeoli]CAK1254344.1 unnamed protein product [Fructobacillus tropaeoli]